MTETTAVNGRTQQRYAVDIPPLPAETLRVEVEGLSPLITHRFSEAAQAKITEKQQKKAKTAREARDPDAEAKAGLYIISEEEERFGLPTISFKKAMADAAYRFLGEKSTKGVKGTVFVRSDHGKLTEINSPGWQLRTDRVKIGQAYDLRYRPQFFPWDCVLTIDYDTSVYARDQIIQLVQYAGMSIGVGDYRVERGGDCGQFQVTRVELLAPDVGMSGLSS